MFTALRFEDNEVKESIEAKEFVVAHRKSFLLSFPCFSINHTN